MKNTISAVIHTLNEEANIRTCLESVKWVDEIIIIDMGSEDKTLSIAKEYNACIYTHEKVRYVDLARNFGLSKVTSEWTLVLDADEILPEKLKDLIATFLESPDDIVCMEIPRKNIVFGEWANIYFPDFQRRFFKSGTASWNGYVHHCPDIDGKIWKLPEDPELAIIHHSFETVSDNLKKLDYYSFNYAQDFIENKIPFDYPIILNRFRKLLYDRLKELEQINENPYEFFLKNITLFGDIIYQAKWWEASKGLNIEARVPLCSIIILCHNNLPLTQQCLQALYQNTQDVNYEVIVIDNASSDKTFEYLLNIPWIRAIRNNENLSFAKAANQASKYARGKYLVFINNDTIPQEKWLSEMLDLHRAKPDAGMVGSKLIFPVSNKIQHAGIAFTDECMPQILYLDFDSDTVQANKVREVKSVIGASMLITKNLFDEIGMFDENYVNYLEDTDLCLKVGEKGLKVYYCPTSVLYHYMGGTELFHEATNNVKYFKNKWQDKITPDAEEIYKKDGFNFINEPESYRIESIGYSKTMKEAEKKTENEIMDIGGTQPSFDKKNDDSDSIKEENSSFEINDSSSKNAPMIEIPASKKRLLVVTRYHRLKKGWSITMDKIYNTNILQQEYEIHQLAWHAPHDGLVDGINVYCESKFNELSNRMEEAIILSNPDVILLHADPHFFMHYNKILKLWNGPKVGWFPVDGEGHPNTWHPLLENITELASLTDYGRNQLELKKSSKGKRVTTVYLGVDHNVFKPGDDESRKNYRRELGIPDDATVFLTVGNNFWRKGVYMAVEMFARFVKKYSINDAYLYLYTNMDKPLSNLIEDKEDLNGKILYPYGYNPFSRYIKDTELAKYYQASDIFLLPTMAEGFGMPFLEAQACGIPIIASSNSAVTEVVGESGLLIDCPGDFMGLSGDYYIYQHPPSIEKGIELMYNLYKDKDLRDKLGKAGINKAKQCTWENTANGLKNIFTFAISDFTGKYGFEYPEPEVLNV